MEEGSVIVLELSPGRNTRIVRPLIDRHASIASQGARQRIIESDVRFQKR